MIIDTHAHLYSTQFDDEVEALQERAKDNRVEKIVMPNIDLETLPKMLVLTQKYPELCLPMLGLHPCNVFENYREVLKELYSFFDKNKFVAVGEIGLDLYHDKSLFLQQQEAFHIQINWALEKNLPINIHSRSANDQAIAIVSEYKIKGLSGIFHCFSGSYEQAQEMISLGFYLGIGGVVTFKNSGLDVILQKIGLQNIVLETDAPYLAPVPYRGKRNEPAYLTLVVEKLSSIYNISTEEVLHITTANAKAVYKL